jgi:peptide/nickel transport system permease protein
MAATFLFAVFVVLGNLLADVLYAVVDPRIRYERT